MPSLTTRRRRAGLDAAGESSGANSSESMLEGGGRRSEKADDAADTQAKLKQYQTSSAAQEEIQQRAHMFAFPLFLCGLLCVFSHTLHLSLLSCILIPLGLGALLFGGTLFFEKFVSKKDGGALFTQHGTPIIVILLVFTMVGLAVSQLVFRDKFGKPLL